VSGGGEDEGRYYLELRRGAEALDPAYWLKKP
jgi:septal ring factor EnvC (AmiA/AmiB activator)